MDIPPTVGLQKAAFGIHFFAYHYMTNSGIYVNGFVSCGGGGIGSKRPDPLFPKEPDRGLTCIISRPGKTVAPTV